MAELVADFILKRLREWGAPQISAHAFCGVPNLRHLEYFHDHVRVKALFFDGVLEAEDAELRPDRSRPGHGLELRHSDAQRYAA
jgi:hypothetical protein